MNPISLLELVDTPEGELTGKHYKTGEGISIAWRDGIIQSIVPVELGARSAHAPWIAPALVELQVNGYGGVDYHLDTTAEEGLLKSVRALRRDACARVLLTLVTREWNELMGNLKRLKAIRDNNPELKKAIFGWHIEGPFISGEPGYIGAHDPNAACNPTTEAIDKLKAIVGDDPTLLTLAPERDGSMEVIRHARQLGIIVSLGHTNASRCHVHSAVEAGAQAFTHLGNGCPQLLDRHANILWHVLDASGLVAGIIPDTHHVSPPAFRLFHKLLPKENIYWTTDAMSGAGAPPGLYTIGKHEIEVGPDRIARQPGKQNFAGSALEPLRGIHLGAEMLGEKWNNVWDYFSVAPARLMGRDHSLAPGGAAIFCLLEEQA